MDESAIAIVKLDDNGSWWVKSIIHGRWDIKETAVNILKCIRDYQPIAAGIEKGSGKPNISKVGKITKAQVKEIAMKKMPDLNSKDIEGAMKVVEGSARSAGITIVD